MYDESVMCKSLENLIKAMCADFGRRALVIEERSAPYNVIMEYRFLNYRILEAAIEVSGSRDAREYISDIGLGIGYANSALNVLSEHTYKTRKKEIKRNIARRLSLF